MGHPAVLYKINPDKKDPKHLPGLVHPAVIMSLQLIRNIQVIYQGLALTPYKFSFEVK